MSFCAFAELVTTFIFFSAWDKSHVKLDNSRNATQKILFLIRNNDNKQTRFFKLVDCYSVWIWLFAEDIAIIEGLGTNPELSKKINMIVFMRNNDNKQTRLVKLVLFG